VPPVCRKAGQTPGAPPAPAAQVVMAAAQAARAVAAIDHELLFMDTHGTLEENSGTMAGEPGTSAKRGAARGRG
jgi:hypothetical protein